MTTDDAAIRERLEFVTRHTHHVNFPPSLRTALDSLLVFDVPALLDRVAALEKAAADVLVYVDENSDYDDERRDARKLRALLDAAPSSAQEPEADGE